MVPDIVKSSGSLLQSHYEENPELKKLVKMITSIDTPEDKWIVYELGGKTLS